MSTTDLEGKGICERHRIRCEEDDEYRQESYRAPSQRLETANDPATPLGQDSSGKAAS